MQDPATGTDFIWNLLKEPRNLTIFILWGVGFFLKQTPHIKTYWIPWILLGVGPILSVAITLADSSITDLVLPVPVLALVRLVIINGIWGLAYAIFAVLTHNRLKNWIETRRSKKQENGE